MRRRAETLVLAGLRGRDPVVAGIAATAVLLALLAFLCETVMLDALDRDAVLLLLPEVIGRRLDESHLWTEQFLSGDDNVDLERDVHVPLRRAGLAVDAALTGAPVSPELSLARVEDGPARASLERLRAQLAGLVQATRQRLASPQYSGPGTEIDARFDRDFRQTLAELRQLAGRIAEVAGHNRRLLHWAYRAASVALVLLLAGIASLYGKLRAREREERRRLEQGIQERTAQLVASEARLRALIETAADGIITIDAGGRVESFNRAASRIFGYAPEEILGCSVRALMPSDYHAPHEAGLARYLETGVAKVVGRPVELEGLRKDGTRFPLAISISDVNLGERRTFLGTMRDITEQKRAAEELQRARQLAEDAARAKAEFLANMSHEIRTPLNGVIGMAGLLADTRLDPVQREYAGYIRSSADHLLNLLNDVLDFSKIEAGKLSLEPIPFDLHDVAAEAVELLAPRAAEKGLELLIRYDAEAPRRFSGDPGRIRQVLVNLVGNAVKFTSAGHVLVDVHRLHAADGIVEIGLTVQDTGIGIPEDRLGRLFEMFTQADASTTRQFGGTGLGLAISQRLVDLMGGRIGARSEPGKGSEFWFTLRLPLDTSPSPPAASPPASPQILQGLRVLIVDDNALNRRILREQMERTGMRPGEAEGGPAALAALAAARALGEPFALAVLDFHMAGMDGEAVARAVRANPGNDGTALLLLTSSSHHGDTRRIYTAGFGAYLVKPVRPALLLEALAALHVAHRKGLGQPLITKHSLLAETASRAEPPAAGNGPGGAPALALRILVAEDNTVNQKVAARSLEKMGCRVDIAGNGREALEMIERLPYDLVFMDCQMPEVDGYQATARIRARRDGRETVPIIAMTAHALTGDREKCLAAGMDDYVSKPVTADELRATLHRWAGVRSPRTAAGTVAPPAPGAPCFCLQELVAFLDGDEAATRDVLETFQREAPDMLQGLQEAVRTQDRAAVEQVAHRLTGALLCLNARAAAGAAQSLEGVAREGAVARFVEALGSLERELQRLAGEISSGLRTLACA